jgi:iron complex outermembrane recepter protein
MRNAARGTMAVLLALASSVGAQTLAAQGGVVIGRVVDSARAPVARAVVSLDGTNFRATTGSDGRYEITDVPAGGYTVRARMLGYVQATARVTVVASATALQDFTLAARAIALSPIDVVVGSRARHTAADELAVPVDVYSSAMLAQAGSNETGQILQALSPSVNFPHQSVTDATDVVRPFTLRGLSPDHTLVLLNGLRRHQTAVVNTFAYGTGAGSSGVDLNTIPSSALDRVEVLRDGASAQYGSDAIAGVVNIVLKEGVFNPFLNVTTGRYIPDDYPDDGTTADVSGGVGVRLGRGSLALFGEFLDRQPTNRAWADIYEDGGTGVTDSINAQGQVVVKRNATDQPNHHWGDGLEKDVMTLANLTLPLNPDGTSELYAFGGYSYRQGTGNGYRRCAVTCGSFITGRSWAEIYPLGFLPEFNPRVTDYSVAGGFRTVAGGWSVDVGASFGHNDFEYRLRNTLNLSLGPCLDPANPCAPGANGTFGDGDDPGIPNQTSFYAGTVARDEVGATLTAARQLSLGLPAPVSLAVGAAFRSERFEISAGELASRINGGHLPPDSAGPNGNFGDGDDNLTVRAGSQVFSGFDTSDVADESRSNFGFFADAETNLTPQLLVALAGRFESYSDFGERLTGKLALRYQAASQLVLRAAGSTGFRAPGLGQTHFSKVVTNVIGGVPTEVGVFPVGDSAAQLLGAVRLKDERSVNLSAGVAYSATENLTVTADLFRITIKDRILLGATFDDAVTLGLLAGAGYTSIGGVQYFTNGLDTRTTGVDLTADLRVPAGGGTLQLTAALNHTRNKIIRVDSLPPALDTLGSTEPGIIDSVTYIGITEERPDWRATLTGEYSAGRARVLLRISYFGEFSSAQPGFCDLCREIYGSKTLADLELGYSFAQVTVALGIRNLFDTYPDGPGSLVDVGGGVPAKDFNGNSGTFPWAAASPFGYNGRYIYTRASIPLNY